MEKKKNSGGKKDSITGRDRIGIGAFHGCSRSFLFSSFPPSSPRLSGARFTAANFNEIRTEVCIIGSRGRRACSRPLCLAGRDCRRWNFHAPLATRTCVSVAFYTWTATRFSPSWSFSPREFPRCLSPRSPSFPLSPRSTPRSFCYEQTYLDSG